MLEGRVVIFDCGCFRIVSYHDPELILSLHVCGECLGKALDFGERMLYLDKVGSVSASDGDGDQLWLT